jgi:hypothetical protein
MVIDMNDVKLVTLEQLRGFLAGTNDLGLNQTADAVARYTFIKSVLKRFKYPLQSKPHRGLIRRYLRRVTGYSRPQLTRLIAQYLASGRLVQRYTSTATSYTRKFTAEDVLLLAELDSLHGTLSGPATRVLLQRAFHRFGQLSYVRLATISVSHLYNLRAKPVYQRRRIHYTGARRRPKADPGSSASIRFTRAITTASRACTTSMPWTSSRSGNWRRAASASAKRTCYP